MKNFVLLLAGTGDSTLYYETADKKVCVRYGMGQLGTHVYIMGTGIGRYHEIKDVTFPRHAGMSGCIVYNTNGMMLRP